MTKKKYIKPIIEVQQFTPNEFCSSCHYYSGNFKCDAGGVDLDGPRPYEMYKETNGIPGLQASDKYVDNGWKKADKCLTPGQVHYYSCDFDNFIEGEIFPGYIFMGIYDIPSSGDVISDVWIYDSGGGHYHATKKENINISDVVDSNHS